MVTLEQHINALIWQGNDRKRSIDMRIAELKAEREVIVSHNDDLEALRNRILEEKSEEE